ncbi:MAG: hypothetical protein R2806_23290 [Saprospiraceae bacterium]
MSLEPHEMDRLDEYLLGRGTTGERNAVASLIASQDTWQKAYLARRQWLQQLRYHYLAQQLRNLQELEKKLPRVGDLKGDAALIANDGAGRHYKTPIMTEESPNRHALRYHGLMQMARQLQSIEQQGHPFGRVKKGPTRRLIWTVSSVAGLLLLLLVIWPYLRPQTEGEKLFAKNFVPPDVHIQTRGASPSPGVDSLSKLAYGAYVTGEYRLSLRYFRKIGFRHDSTFVKIYGLTLLLNDKPAEAIDLFGKGKQEWPESPVWDEGIGWALLKQNHVQEARKYIKLE